MTDKDSVLTLLKEYGDSHSNHNMKLSKLIKNLEFLKLHGSKENNLERFLLTKDIPTSNYKTIMTIPIEDLRLKHLQHKEKNEIIQFLLKFGYKENYLRKKKYHSILKIKNDPKLYQKYERKELLSIICNDYGISPKTARNWNFQKTKNFVQKNLSHISLFKRNTDTHNYLRSLSNSLFCDIINS